MLYKALGNRQMTTLPFFKRGMILCACREAKENRTQMTGPFRRDAVPFQVKVDRRWLICMRQKCWRRL